MPSKLLEMISWIVLLAFPSAQALFTKPLDTETAHYTIQDMILRYRNLTSTENRDISLFDNANSEFSTNVCVKEAVAPILQKCMSENINELSPKLRSRTAAKLSVCEFEVAGIYYPDECHGQSRLDECVVAMERKSQWWTSYSGYYRSIGELCHQESLHYEKENIISMFLDITEHYSKILEFLKEYSVMTELFKEESLESFVKMMEFLKDISRGTEENKKQFEDVWSIIKDQLFKVGEMSNNVSQLIVKQTGEFEDGMSSLFKSVHNELNFELGLLKDQFVTEIEERDFWLKEIMDSTKLGLMQLNLLGIENSEVALRVKSHLKGSIRSVKDLNETLVTMDDSTKELIGQISSAREAMVDVSDILQNNPFLRAMVYLTQNFTIISTELILLFISMTSLCFFFFLVCFSTLSVFRYLGLALVSTISGYFMACWFAGLTH